MSPHEAVLSDNPRRDVSVLDSSGTLDVRLAGTLKEVEAAQRLRFDVFYREMGAHPTPEMLETGRDFDEFDPVCEQLLVIDREKGDVVATYRLMDEEGAKRS